LARPEIAAEHSKEEDQPREDDEHAEDVGEAGEAGGGPRGECLGGGIARRGRWMAHGMAPPSRAGIAPECVDRMTPRPPHPTLPHEGGGDIRLPLYLTR